ncbi:hypothetical protein MKW92_039590 [Papaver armeniacum]|nr:hypothetical protein MKW92_039590 [Papaver armeniacum]
MTGEQPALAEKALQALTGKIKELKAEGSPTLTVKKAAQFVPKFSDQMKNENLIEFLAVGLDLDEERNLRPCLFYATTSGSVKTDAYATGLGSIYSQSVLDWLFKKQMSIDEAVDVALTAVYSAAFCNEVKGQAVETVHVCVITSQNTTILRYGVKFLHEKYAPLLKEREDQLLRNPVPRYEYTVSDSDSDSEDW